MSHPDFSYDPDNSYEDDMHDEDYIDDAWYDDIDDSMDGDHESGFASAGWGMDESYRDDIDAYENYYGEDY